MANNIVSCSSSTTTFTNTITTSSVSTPSLYTHPPLNQQTLNFNSSGNLFTQEEIDTHSNHPQQQNQSTQIHTNNNMQPQINQTPSPTWQVVRNNKRKTPGDASTLKMRFIKATQEAASTSTSNYYNPIAMDQDNTDTNTQQNTTENNKKADPKPPPVFIHGVVNYQEMISNILTVLKEEDYVCRSLANNVVKVNPKTIDAYRALVTHVRSQGIIFHTYQAKQDKAYRVAIRHIHHSVPIQDIKQQLELLGFKVRNVTNVLKRTTKDPLNIFFVDLEPSDNNKKIYDLKYFMHMKISVEAPRKTPSLVQCTRCQNYNHTKAYCSLPYSCVKCGGSHNSATCTKTRDTPATCSLCDGPHPANYRGCTVYKDLQKLRNRPNPTENQTNTQYQAKQTTSDLTYSQAIQTNLPHLTRNKSQPEIRINTHNNNPEISLSSFLQEFKTMFNQLIQQNSMILNMLNTVITKIIPK